MLKMFLDDERHPVGEDWVIIRSSEAAKIYVTHFGMPDYISFDHDLGGDDNAMLFVNWLIDYDLDNDGGIISSTFEFYVHSQNPVGAKNIQSLLDNYLKTKK